MKTHIGADTLNEICEENNLRLTQCFVPCDTMSVYGEVEGFSVRVSDHSGRGSADINIVYDSLLVEEINEQEEEEAFADAQKDLRAEISVKLIRELRSAQYGKDKATTTSIESRHDLLVNSYVCGEITAVNEDGSLIVTEEDGDQYEIAANIAAINPTLKIGDSVELLVVSDEDGIRVYLNLEDRSQLFFADLPAKDKAITYDPSDYEPVEI